MTPFISVLHIHSFKTATVLNKQATPSFDRADDDVILSMHSADSCTPSTHVPHIRPEIAGQSTRECKMFRRPARILDAPVTQTLRVLIVYCEQLNRAVLPMSYNIGRTHLPLQLPSCKPMNLSLLIFTSVTVS